MIAWGLVFILSLLVLYQHYNIKSTESLLKAQQRLNRTLATNNEMLVEMCANLKKIIYGKPTN